MIWISLADYFHGHDTGPHSLELSLSMRASALRTVEIANQLLDEAFHAGVDVDHPSGPFRRCNSGWRPATVNAATPNAAPNSLHMTCEAIDINDPNGELDEWLLSTHGQALLAKLGLWMEHPAATKGWCHVQTRPPRSGRRVFYP